MIPALLLNANTPRDGLEDRLFGGKLQIAIHRGPADPADMPSPRDCVAAQGIVSQSANHGIGPPSEFPSCRVLVRMGVGYDSLDIAAWGAAGVPVCNVPDYGTSEVADHAIALMLALVRGTSFYHERLARAPATAWTWAGAPAVRRLRGAVFGA